MTKPELAQWASPDGTGRAYKHPFRTVGEGKDAKPLTSPSVTTVLKLVAKDALIQWAANQTIAWAVDNVSLLFTKERESAIRSGKWRWQDVRDERAEVGTGVHETIESLHTGGWNFPPLDDEQLQIMEQWYRLQERYEFTPHRSEFTVWYGLDDTLFQPGSFDYSWAGTGDGRWDILDRKTGEFYSDMTIDLKTSRNTWPEHWLQLAALYHADVIMEKQDDGTWIEVPNVRGDGTAIIHLRADKAEVHIETDPEIIQLQFSEFMGYRNVLEFHRKIEELKVAREKRATNLF